MAKKKKILLMSVVLIVGFLIGRSTNFSSEDDWSGIYYPQGNLSGNAIYSPRFSSKEECIGWAINERGLRPEDTSVSPADLWECNKNCRLSPDYSTLINSAQQYRQELFNDNRGSLYVCDDGGFDGGDWLRGDF